MSAAEKLKALNEAYRLDQIAGATAAHRQVLDALPQIVALVEAAELAIPVSACDWPEGACMFACTRTSTDASGCLRIQALDALAALDEALT